MNSHKLIIMQMLKVGAIIGVICALFVLNGSNLAKGLVSTLAIGTVSSAGARFIPYLCAYLIYKYWIKNILFYDIKD